ncbi:MAG: long-chain fatty acid--CoA ligase [Thermoanaerobaculales bacterium]|nr:long-chain fatty acid--CoA ligase [Thermoanaerobaculales bacterium]
MTVRNVLDIYRRETEEPREEHYFHYFPGGKRVFSTEEFFERTSFLAVGLGKLGLKRGDRLMLLMDNRPEWHMVDLATIVHGAIDVPIYGTLTPEQIAYQAQDSGAKIVIAENSEQMAKFLKIKDQCPDLETLIQIEGETAEGVLTIEEIIDSGDSDNAGDLFWEWAAKVKPEDTLTLIYTSGTTGNPKGVELTHANLVENVLPSSTRALIRSDEDFALEFLPLCHVFERMLGYLYMYVAIPKAYCSVHHVADLLAEIKPTVFASVPRLFEKIHDRIQGKVAEAPAVRQALFNWALNQGKKAYPERLAGRRPGGLAYKLADKLVLSKVREGLGGRVQLCVSGGAPLPQFVGEFLHSIGIWVIEGYGLTETSPVIAVNGATPNMTRLGTVGKVIDNVEAKIAEDGELCVRGPSIMSGYWNLPDKTAEVFDEDGFFLTGDIAEIDDDGFIRITDRKKDLIVTAGGKNIAPQPIENEIKRSIFIDNVVLIGDKKPFMVALISPNEEELASWAKGQDLQGETTEELSKLPEVISLFDDVISKTNKNLARYEQVGKFAVLPLMLSIESGHLTPTMKVKRRVVEKDHQDLIDGMYEK